MITIIKPGLLSSIQDIGRYGFQKYGVISNGSMDCFAHRIANILVGNEENTPTIEMTLQGASILFQQDSLIAICGGDFSPSINGIPIGTWRPILVKKGTVLQFNYAKHGCRAYLAVAGGFTVPMIMGSTSTYLRAKMGGFKGRALQAGDEIPIGFKSKLSDSMIQHLNARIKSQPYTEMEWYVSPSLFPGSKIELVIRVMLDRQYRLFTASSLESFFIDQFTVSTQSDRMGYRLQGPSLQLKEPRELLSEAVAFGTVQVPGDGNPIVLLADRQTTGGYPKIAQIASIDFPLIAQAKPGDCIHFTKITHQEAQQLYIERERKIIQLKKAILHKYY